MAGNNDSALAGLGCIALIALIPLIIFVSVAPVAWVLMLVLGALGYTQFSFWICFGIVFVVEGVLGVLRGSAKS